MHLSRKVFHASGVLIVGIYHGAGLDRAFVAWALWAIVAMLAALDVLRACVPAVQARFHAAFARILDRKDDRGPNGSTLYFAGCALSVSLVAGGAACGGILALALGDSMAAIVGSTVRSPRLGRVSLAGSTACLVAATLGCRARQVVDDNRGATKRTLEAVLAAKHHSLLEGSQTT